MNPEHEAMWTRMAEATVLIGGGRDAPLIALVQHARCTALRRWYPFTSMSRLCLSARPWPWEPSDVQPGFVDVQSDGRYLVFSGGPYDDTAFLVATTRLPAEAVETLLNVLGGGIIDGQLVANMKAVTLAGCVDSLANLLPKWAAERGRELPEWDRVLVTSDEGAGGDLDDVAWAPLAEAEPLLSAACTRTTREWVNVGAHHVADGTLYVVIEFLTDQHGEFDLPPERVSVNLHGPSLRWLDGLPTRSAC